MSLNEEDPIRLQVWRRALGVEDAKITEHDLQAQNGVIHIINKVITPSNQSLNDVLRSIPYQSFETFLEAVERVSQEGDEDALLSLGPGDNMFYTFFVPTDQAFRRVGQSMLRRLEEDEEFARAVVRQHVAVNMFPETSFEQGLVYTVKAMAGPYDIKKTRGNILKVNDEEVTSSHLCANGVIHVINRAFMPDSSYTNTNRTTSSRRTYQSVTFAERYNGVNRELPGVTQGSFDAYTARATRRQTAKRKRGGSSSSNTSSTIPASLTTEISPQVVASFTTPSTPTSPPLFSSPTEQDTVDETYIEDTELEAHEDETSLNALDESSEAFRTPNSDTESYKIPGLKDGLGSPLTRTEGSTSEEESISSIPYEPSPSTNASTYSSSSTSVTQGEIHSVDSSRQTSSSISSSSYSHPYDTDLDVNSSPTPSSSSSFSSYSSSHRHYGIYPDSRLAPGSSSSSSNPQSHLTRDLENERSYSSPSSSSSSSSSSQSSSTLTSHSRNIGGSSYYTSTSRPVSSVSSSSSSSSTSIYHTQDQDLGPEPSLSSSHSSSSSGHSISRTRVESPSSSSSSTFSLSSRHPDGSGSSSRSYFTNHTRHYSQIGRTWTRPEVHSISRVEESRTNHRTSGSNIIGSEANVRSGSNLRESGSNLRVNTDLRDSSHNERGGSVSLRESAGDIRGSSSYSRGSSSETSRTGYSSYDRGSSSSAGPTNIASGSLDTEQPTYVNRESTRTEVTGSGTHVMGSDSETLVSGRGSGSTLRASGGYTRGSNTNSRGSSMVVSGSSSGGGSGQQRETDRGYTTSSRTYNYHHSEGRTGLEAREDQHPYRHSYNSPTVPTVNTKGSRFNYVGHSYGQDVVGHEDQLLRVTQSSPPLPYRIDTPDRREYARGSSGIKPLGDSTGSFRALEGVGAGGEGVNRTVYKYSKTSHVQEHVQGPTAIHPAPTLHTLNTGHTTTIGSVRRSSRRRYNITKTSYTYSVPVLHSRRHHNNHDSLSPVSAYAFTGDEDMYADGTELADRMGVGVETLTREQERRLRRRHRRKRGHKTRHGGLKGRRRRNRKERKNTTLNTTTAKEE